MEWDFSTKAFETGSTVYAGMATPDETNSDHILNACKYTVSQSELVKVIEKAYDNLKEVIIG